MHEFASKQNQGDEGFLAADPSATKTAEASKAAASNGMAEMSVLYNSGGRELYIGAGDRERD